MGYTATTKRFSGYTLRGRSPSSVSAKPLSGSNYQPFEDIAVATYEDIVLHSRDESEPRSPVFPVLQSLEDITKK